MTSLGLDPYLMQRRTHQTHPNRSMGAEYGTLKREEPVSLPSLFSARGTAWGPMPEHPFCSSCAGVGICNKVPTKNPSTR